MSEEVILPGLRSYAMRRAKEEVETSKTLSRGRTPALPRMMTTKMLETAKVQTRASRACPLGAKWMILLDAELEMARLLPRYQEP